MSRALFCFALLLPTAALVAQDHNAASATDPVQRVTERAIASYAQRLEQATSELTSARERILREQQPLAEQERTLETQVADLETEIVRLETLDAQKAEKRQQLAREAADLRKNQSYLATLAQDTLKTFSDSLLPGEASAFADRITRLQQSVEQQSRGNALTACRESIDLALERTQQQIGGYAVSGRALVGDDNRLVAGTFAFIGPETFFRSESGAAGTVRTREGGVPVCYPVAEWTATQALALMSGAPASIAADPSGGKALRLQEISGTLWEHIQRGGVVAYAILLVGFLALVIIVQKSIDAAKIAVDTPATVGHALQAVRRGSRVDAEAAIVAMKRSTRDLFETGLRHVGKPKHILEEHLFARTLQMRLHFERRLPLLAVIATASPLMGLLGTVMGMVKTFALITVFGTGNAGKLSGGISEVLVATELGLMVAIPALVAHGFLSHRIQKNLSLLDRYAVEFVTAAEEAKAGTFTDEYVAT